MGVDGDGVDVDGVVVDGVVVDVVEVIDVDVEPSGIPCLQQVSVVLQMSSGMQPPRE